MENPLADDAGKGDLPRPRFEPAAHAVSFLAAVGTVSAARPVIEQNGQLFVLRGGDGFYLLVNNENTVGICLIVPQKGGFYKQPEGLVTEINFVRKYPKFTTLVKKLISRGSASDIFETKTTHSETLSWSALNIANI